MGSVLTEHGTAKRQSRDSQQRALVNANIQIQDNYSRCCHVIILPVAGVVADDRFPVSLHPFIRITTEELAGRSPFRHQPGYIPSAKVVGSVSGVDTG